MRNWLAGGIVLVVLLLVAGIWYGGRKGGEEDIPVITFSDGLARPGETPAIDDAVVPFPLPADATPPLADVNGVPSRETGVPPVVASLLGEGGDKLVRPPLVDEEGRPPVASPFDSSVARLAQEIAVASGPETAMHARNLIDSDQDGVGLVGAVLMADQPDWAWDDSLYDALAGHRDPAVGLAALQALRDAGRNDEAAHLRSLLADRFDSNAEMLFDLVDGRGLPGVALRAWMDLSQDVLEPAARIEALTAVVGTDHADYAGRIQALWELRTTMEFPEFRELVQAETAAAGAGDIPDVWQMGIRRLAERLEGPVAVHEGPVVMSVHDVQILTARELPTMYDDLAAQLEVMTATGTGLFGPGVQDELRGVVESGLSLPGTDDAYRALRRITMLIDRIEEIDLDGLVPPPPPEM